MHLEPLDLLVCLELAAGGSRRRTDSELASSVGLSASEPNQAVQRAVEAGLLRATYGVSHFPSPEESD